MLRIPITGSVFKGFFEGLNTFLQLAGLEIAVTEVMVDHCPFPGVGVTAESVSVFLYGFLKSFLAVHGIAEIVISLEGMIRIQGPAVSFLRQVVFFPLIPLVPIAQEFMGILCGGNHSDKKQQYGNTGFHVSVFSRYGKIHEANSASHPAIANH